MESIYWVINHACHRRCKHCYDERFRPYVRDALEKKVVEAETAFPAIIDNLPDRLGYIDEEGARHAGRIIMAGGEVLVDPVRERVLYPILEGLQKKYGDEVHVIVQTTGDLVTGDILDELLARGVWLVSVAGMDDFHVGHEGDKRIPLIDHLHGLFASRAMVQMNEGEPVRKSETGQRGWYNMFGATEDAWIGKLWPRGRAWQNGLTTAGIEDNFCNAWSGGLGFLNHGQAGSEVSVEPDGKVYPCCLKTAAPLGDLMREKLTDMLDSLKAEPALQAINAGDPSAMGVAYGWEKDDFFDRTSAPMPNGKACTNLCLGCDAFFTEVLSPILKKSFETRIARSVPRSVL